MKKNENDNKMTPFMKAMKAAHSISSSGVLNQADLEKHRASQEYFARLVAPSATKVDYEEFDLEGMEAMWAKCKSSHYRKQIILYCHGGGFINGGLGYASILAGKLAMYTGIDVLTYAYRLTPENPYPAALEDSMLVWDYLMYMGYGARDIIIAGDSAGGNLALEIALRLKEQRRQLPKALILMSPWTDMHMDAPSYTKYKDLDPILSKEYIEAVRSAYLGGDTNYANPKYSPLYADLTGFPPTLIQAGSNEILRSDSERLLKKLHKCNVHALLQVYKGGWHVFQQMPVIKAAKALEDIRDFIYQLI